MCATRQGAGWRLQLAGLLLAVSVLVAAAPAWAVQCWRGWGYLVDPASGAYKSEELLLVTKGPIAWAPGSPVTLYLLDRATGAIRSDSPPLRLVPATAHVYYRGNLNYVDGRGRIVGSDDGLAFGLSHIAPPAAPIARLEAYNRWACGLAPTGE